MNFINQLAEVINLIDHDDDTYHIERMCVLEEKLRNQLSKDQQRLLDLLLTMHGAVEQRSGRDILLVRAEECISFETECAISTDTDGMKITHTRTGLFVASGFTAKDHLGRMEVMINLSPDTLKSHLLGELFYKVNNES